ncbi:MAG TPA: peptide-methionine (S)-S-oxide reductase [Allosphingosinicella sp.]
MSGRDQRREAEAALAEANRVLGGRAVTPILPLGRFWEAEGYHQDYWRNNPIRYRYYRTRCGRDARLAELWGER